MTLHPPTAPRRVIVVGGGIAGLAAAVTLAQRGVAVELLETRKKLGGRATSFDDPRTGEELDNCQHVALGCCTNYIHLLRTLGAHRQIDFANRLWWIENGGRVTQMRSHDWLPAPLHLAPSFVAARFLTISERAEIAAAMAAALRTPRDDWRTRTFREWLDDHAQSPGAVRKFWFPVMVSACNAPAERIAASVALHVLQEGFLAHRRSFEVGVPRVPLRRLYDGAARIIERAGGRVCLGAGATAVNDHEVELRSGERRSADRVVLAVPVERASALLNRGGAIDARLPMLDAFEPSPIVGVHLRFDRPVFTLPHAALVDAGTQWLFRKDGAGCAVHAVVSGADDWLALTEAQAVDRVVEDVRRFATHELARSARGAQLLAARVVKEKRATWAPTTATEANRPPALGDSGVILAGCYTDTGWPSTMEGAARSGYIAAAAALNEPTDSFLRPSLTPALPSRLLGAATLRRQHRTG